MSIVIVITMGLVAYESALANMNMMPLTGHRIKARPECVWQHSYQQV